MDQQLMGNSAKPGELVDTGKLAMLTASSRPMEIAAIE